jgi:hypothetical protein
MSRDGSGKNEVQMLDGIIQMETVTEEEQFNPEPPQTTLVNSQETLAILNKLSNDYTKYIEFPQKAREEVPCLIDHFISHEL